MRSLWIATAAIAVATAPAAQGQAVARSQAGGATFGRATAGPGGAFAQSSSGPAPIIRPNIPRGGWTVNQPPRQPMMPRPQGGGWTGQPPRGGMPNTQPPRGGMPNMMPPPGMPRPGGPSGGLPSSPAYHGTSRWGGQIGGHWYGGVYAPGGWNGYRRPSRGWRLPSYWFAPSFYITDYAAYGLGAPPYGYTWTRYYDDAVLVDQRGRVQDSVYGLDWDRYGDSYDDSRAYDDGDAYYADGRDDVYAPAPRYRERSDDGVGGAVIGGVVGGVAGNVIAGRGNRLAGTVIGAGVGALAGAAIDRAEDRAEDRARYHDAPPPPPYRTDDRDPRRGGQGHSPAGYPPQSGYVERYDARGYPGGGYTQTIVSGGSYYSGGGITVTVAPTVTTTTTTTEIVFASAPAHRYKRVYRARPQPRCQCSKILSR